MALALFAGLTVLGWTPAGAQAPAPTTLRVAAVQLEPRRSVEENLAAILDAMAEAAAGGARVAVFSEAVVTGYVREVIDGTTTKQLRDAEQRLADGARRHRIYTVVGIPFDSAGKRYNTAVVFSPDGGRVARQPKINLVRADAWAVAGETLSVFSVDGIRASIIVCHDERYPELVRLPVLAGARVIFYVSSESPIELEHKLDPYRAQISARADENDVFVVHANAPALRSHGQSRIIAPDGNLIEEAPMFGDRMIVATLDLTLATGATALRSLESPFRDWWKEGLKHVTVLP